jgi:hypothetical protein
VKRILAVLMLMTTSAYAQDQPCTADALIKAGLLLRFHVELKPTDPVDIDPQVKALPPVKALKGNGHFDVLEVTGHYIKATYRMRFLYAPIRGTCPLMGQEILEVADPY